MRAQTQHPVFPRKVQYSPVVSLGQTLETVEEVYLGPPPQVVTRSGLETLRAAQLAFLKPNILVCRYLQLSCRYRRVFVHNLISD